MEATDNIKIMHFARPKKPRKPIVERVDDMDVREYDTSNIEPKLTLEDYKNVAAIVAWSVWAICGIVATWIGCRAALAAWIGA